MNRYYVEGLFSGKLKSQDARYAKMEAIRRLRQVGLSGVVINAELDEGGQDNDNVSGAGKEGKKTDS